MVYRYHYSSWSLHPHYGCYEWPGESDMSYWENKLRVNYVLGVFKLFFVALWNILSCSVPAGRVYYCAETTAWLCIGLAVKTILKLNICAMIWLAPVLQSCFSSVTFWLGKSLKWSGLVLRTGLPCQFCWAFLFSTLKSFSAAVVITSPKQLKYLLSAIYWIKHLMQP